MTQTISYNGHITDCICPSCMMADLESHIRSTRTEADADRLLTELGTIAAKVQGERTRFKTPGQGSGRGIVRKISEKQARYLAKLLKTRDFTSLLSKSWFTTDIENISLAGARTFIDALLACPIRPAHEIPVEMITLNQASYMVALIEGREITGTPYAGRTEADVNMLTFDQAKTAITNLLTLPKKAVAAAPTATTKEEIKAVAGLYELAGEIYRMRKARGGAHFYAELLTDVESSAFEYARGMAAKVPAEGRKLSLAECEALSLQMGGCCMCGKTLSATVDGVGPAARFIGPVCGANMGL